jgi:hypothetical protein
MEIDITAEEFYNSCHLRSNGRFCGKSTGKKGAIRVPMSEAARRSNAILRRQAADRRSKEYGDAKRNIKGGWNDREKGQGGIVRDGLAGRGQAAKMRNARKAKDWKSDWDKVDANK